MAIKPKYSFLCNLFNLLASVEIKPFNGSAISNHESITF